MFDRFDEWYSTLLNPVLIQHLINKHPKDIKTLMQNQYTDTLYYSYYSNNDLIKGTMIGLFREPITNSMTTI